MILEVILEEWSHLKTIQAGACKYLLVKSKALVESGQVDLKELIARADKLTEGGWHVIYLSYPERWLTLGHYKDPLVIMNAVRPIYTDGMLFNMKTLPRTLEVLAQENEIISKKCDGDIFKTQYAGYYGYNFGALTSIPTFFKTPSL